MASFDLDVEGNPCVPQYTLEVTGKDIGQILDSAALIPCNTPINIAFLGNEDHVQRIAAARTIRTCGFEPVPIISSRRIRSEDDLNSLLEGLITGSCPSRFMFVGGDPSSPAGPYQDSLALLRSGVVQRHGIRHVGIVGYPEGHPKIHNDDLWASLKWKYAFLQSNGCSVEITTQYGFDTKAVLQWVRRLRAEGITARVRLGVPGPADIVTLLRFAKQFGVVTSSTIVRRYGLSLTNLLRRSVAECYWNDLEIGIKGQDLGEIAYHLYPFGGVADGVVWMNQRISQGSSRCR